MRHGSLFSGIGGFDLAASWMGWENVFHCEWNEFGQKVLKYYWPEAISYGDITKTDFTVHRGSIDILTGGFPCQPYSTAGKRLGKEDDRHLWPEMLRAIKEISPRWIVGENVPGIVSWSNGLVFEQVQADLEAEGYEVQPVILPAVSVNAPHRRDRVWFVCHRSEITPDPSFVRRKLSGRTRTRRNGSENGNLQIASDPDKRRLEGGKNKEETQFSINRNTWDQFPTQSPVCSRNDGVLSGLVGITVSKHRNESIKAYGNAVVPHLVYQIFKAIEQYENIH